MIVVMARLMKKLHGGTRSSEPGGSKRGLAQTPAIDHVVLKKYLTLWSTRLYEILSPDPIVTHNLFI